MQIKVLVVLFFFFIPFILFGRDSYTTGIKLKKLDMNRISIEWLSSTNTGFFLVFRSTNGPIRNPELLTRSEMVFSGITNGTPEKSLFRYPPVIDHIKEIGKYYYLVVQQYTSYEKDDFQATMNYNLSPVMITNIEDEPVSEKAVVIIPAVGYQGVRNLFIKTNTASIQLFWDLDSVESLKSHQFYLYRTDYKITNRYELTNLTPLKELENDFYYEDFDINYGTPYYYTIIVGTNTTLQPGTNQNNEPVFLGLTNYALPLQKEVGQRSRVKKDEFQKQFK